MLSALQSIRQIFLDFPMRKTQIFDEANKKYSVVYTCNNNINFKENLSTPLYYHKKYEKNRKENILIAVDTGP